MDANKTRIAGQGCLCRASLQRRQMTLIELLIVLALLGGLATIAISSMGELSASTRVDTTRQRLEAIRMAVVGDGVAAGRFIADMGRLPQIYDDPSKAADEENGFALRELWEDSRDIGYGNQPSENLKNGSGGQMEWPDSFDGLPESVSLYCGWNGPYLLLPGKKLYDGFGNDFRLLLKQSDNGLNWEAADPDTQDGQEIHGVQSLGQDNQQAGSPEWYNAETDCTFVSTYSEPFSLAPETTLTVVVKTRDVLNNTWLPPVAISNLKTYDDATSYKTDDYVTDSAKKYLYRCKKDSSLGQVPSTPPADDAYWTYCGELGLARQYLSHLRVALFLPKAKSRSETITWKKSWDKVAADIAFDNITPGIRKLYVYGYLQVGDDSVANACSSGLQSIELKPNANFVTVYLTEKLN